MNVYNIGISAIRANQVALQTIANNVANADTEGHHRQRVNLSEAPPLTSDRFELGTGVQVDGIERLRNAMAERSLLMNLSQQGLNQPQLEALQSLETLFNPTTGSLQESASRLFDAVEQLASNPSEEIQRRAVIAAADDLAQEITALNRQLDQLQNEQSAEITATVNRVNELGDQIAAIDRQISESEALGSAAPTLRDQRDVLVSELAGLIDLNPASLADEASTLTGAGGWFVVGTAAPKLSVSRSDDGQLQILIGDGRGPVEPAGGKLAGLLRAHNELVPEVRETLQEWTSALVTGFNSIQATGLGLTGPVSEISGSGTVDDITAPLDAAGGLFPVEQGDLFLTVTDSSTGERTLHRIAIDPATDSLQDVVSQIDALSGVSATVSDSGQVRIAGASGFLIDFAGRSPTNLNLSGVSGTAAPTLNGIYDGLSNRQWTVTALGSGEVGVTPGLTYRVTDSVTGEVIADLDVGAGYAANEPLAIADGMTIQFDAGTVVAGDSIDVDAICNPDTSGFLSALQVGGIFTTSDLRTVQISRSLTSHPELLAAGRSGDVSDAGQLLRLGDFRGAKVLSNGTETLEENVITLISRIGIDVNSASAEVDQLNAQYEQLRSQQDSVSGVDPNEELMLMLQFQRAFQANARFLSSVNDTLDQLLGLVQ